MDVPAPVVGGGEIVVDGERRIVVGERGVVVVLCLMDGAAAEQRVGVRRLQRDRPAEVGNRPRVVAHEFVDVSAQEPGVGPSRLELDGLGEIAGGKLVGFGQGVGEAAFVVGVGSRRVEFDRPGVVRDRAGIVERGFVQVAAIVERPAAGLGLDQEIAGRERAPKGIVGSVGRNGGGHGRLRSVFKRRPW